jgi:S-(hydroxymethyl)glutathione dehydrogenase/alcohol dehydrogenase
VIGAGAVGQFVIQGLRIAGAERIVAVDPSESRRKQSLGLGATAAIRPDELEALTASLPERFDYAYDAVGGPATARTALAAIRNGGIAVLIGMGRAGQALEVDPLEMVVCEKTLVGSIYGSSDPVAMGGRLLSWIADGTLEVSTMIGDTFPLEEVNSAVDVALSGTGGRALLAPDSRSAG